MLVTSMTVLIIACPCALGLATPISIMVGVGKAAEYGIWIRNGKTLQRMGQPGSIVLDKTGTLMRISITAVIRYPTAFYPWVCYNERLEVLQRLGQQWHH